MVAHINTIAFEGINSTDIDIQVHISSGLPAFNIVGLPDKAIGESKERIRSALSAMGLALPSSRITVNLAPADVLKEGSHYDLPIALGILSSMGVIPAEEIINYIVLGELSLDGSITKVAGILPAAIHANESNKGIICPKDNGFEACWAGDITIYAPDHLLSLINHFKGTQILSPTTLSSPHKNIQENFKYPDMADIKGQESAKRALEIAAAGSHNLLMIGPPGAGKSMLAERLPGIIPELSSQEMLEVSMISSITNKIEDGNLVRKRPFRDPHHGCSIAAMVGGGKKAMPGEITLAHNGILFLDELPEFPRTVIDSLRQPLETGKVTVSRAAAHITYPANFQLVAAMNPCRCGYLDDQSRSCKKAPICGQDYQSKISGPLMDRFDLHIQVPAVSPADLYKAPPKEGTKEIRERVVKAREKQIQRYKNLDIRTNSQANGDLLQEITKTSQEGHELLHHAYDKMQLSMRGFNRILRVSRTIADLENSENVEKNHISEALSYRQLQFNKQVA
ncbi:YifB family Mg chelatase-like AAA ATPase [Rickettsiales bacterium]|nr:YifB family Mg chelatase-like AAA ATPase [Rickettsiales bacterium]